MADDEDREKLRHWVDTWLNAARRQVVRIEAGSYEDMEPDAFLYVQAVYNLRRGAGQLLGKKHPAIQEFDAAWPHLKNLRDMIEHFDEYAKGAGKRQREQTMRYEAPFSAMFQRSITTDFKYATVFLADSHIEIHRSLEAAHGLVLAIHMQMS